MSFNRTLISNEEHYAEMDSVFKMTKIGSIAWVINVIVTLVCFIVFFVTDGKELIIAFYIPLDVALNASKAAFFFHEYYNNEKSKQDTAKLDQVLLSSNSSRKTEINEPLMSGQHLTQDAEDSDSKDTETQLLRKTALERVEKVNDDEYLKSMVKS